MLGTERERIPAGVFQEPPLGVEICGIEISSKDLINLGEAFLFCKDFIFVINFR